MVEGHGQLIATMTDLIEPVGDRFAAKLSEIEARREREQQSPMWLTHHWPDEYDRCMRMGGRHACRRCVVLYSVGLITAIGVAAGATLWPARLDWWIVWLGCVPGTTEFVLEQLGVVRHSPRRQVVLTAILAVAFGRGLGAEFQDRWDWLFWGPILAFCTVWGTAAVLGHRRRRR